MLQMLKGEHGILQLFSGYYGNSLPLLAVRSTLSNLNLIRSTLSNLNLVDSTGMWNLGKTLNC